MDNALIREILAKAAEVQGDPNRFIVYFDRPNDFAQEILGVRLWSKQRAVLESMVTGRRVACRSGHGVGKTVVAAVAVLWWLFCRRGVVVTTAPTREHVEDVLWLEINKLFSHALVPLPGDISTSDLKITNEWTATGISTNKASAFQGRHHPYLLAVLDEAPGVDEQIHLEVLTQVIGATNCLLMIGNPTVTSGTFYEAFKEDSGWTKIHISCFEHPNVVEDRDVIPGAVTREWIEEMRHKWGETSPLWFSRVLGQFPRISSRGLIPLAWVERAQDDEKRREILKKEEENRTPRIGGLDVARYGDNKCVYIQRRGDAIEKIISWHHTSLMETADRGLSLIKENGLQFLVVDASGIGAGVVDRLLQQNAPVYAYNGGHRAFTPSSYSNRRTEMWWAVRMRLERQRLWLPQDRTPDVEQLVADLVAPEYSIISSGRIQAETKEKLLERGVPSPDFGDALVLCFAMDENPEEPEPVKPGPRQDWVALEPLNEFGDFSQLPMGF